MRINYENIKDQYIGELKPFSIETIQDAKTQMNPPTHPLADQFLKYSTFQVSTQWTQYDYGSVMHYSARAASKNGLNTITTLRAGGEAIGQRRGMSATDVREINMLYQCSNGGQCGLYSYIYIQTFPVLPATTSRSNQANTLVCQTCAAFAR